MIKLTYVLATLALTLALDSGSIHAQTSSDESRKVALKLITDTCSTCHGSQGRSISPLFPNLAGQTSTYIVAQLQSFKSHSRSDPDAVAFMWGIASQLNDDVIYALADYYSSQRPATPVSADALMIARGEQIYNQGLSADGVAPCAACHGQQAVGINTFPRLAGQHAQYTLKQLTVIKANLRESSVMRTAVLGLKDQDMTAIAYYLQAVGS